MNIIRLNSGTEQNPTILDKKFNADDYVILESGFYILRNDVVVNEMWGSSSVNVMWGSSSVNKLASTGLIVCLGYNLIRQVFGQSINVTLNDTSTILTLPNIENNFDFYKKSYPITIVGKTALMYKAVRKIKGKYLADRDRLTEYKIGQTTQTKLDPNTKNSCSAGLHISHLQWAVNYGKGWENLAIIECEVEIDSLIIAADCDGKVRTNAVKTIRELPLEEYQQYL